MAQESIAETHAGWLQPALSLVYKQGLQADRQLGKSTRTAAVNKSTGFKPPKTSCRACLQSPAPLNNHQLRCKAQGSSTRFQHRAGHQRACTRSACQGAGSSALSNLNNFMHAAHVGEQRSHACRTLPGSPAPLHTAGACPAAAPSNPTQSVNQTKIKPGACAPHLWPCRVSCSNSAVGHTPKCTNT